MTDRKGRQLERCARPDIVRAVIALEKVAHVDQIRRLDIGVRAHDRRPVGVTRWKKRMKSRFVDDPGAVQVTEVEDEEGSVIELHVAEDDMGKVIGRNGSVAKALRTLLKVTAAREGGSVTLEIV